MPIYFLEIKKDAKVKSAGGHLILNKVIGANGAAAARRTAAADAQRINWPEYDDPKSWLDENISTCIRLDTATRGVVCSGGI